MTVDWGGGPAAWDLRPPEFRSVFELLYAGKPTPALMFVPQNIDAEWSETSRLWRLMPENPHLLAALAPIASSGVSLRYAALNWRHPPIQDTPLAKKQQGRIALAKWSVQLIRVFETIRERTDRNAWSSFSRPFALVDLGGAVRVGFLPLAGSHPPESRFDERSLVYTFGTLLRTLCAPDRNGYFTDIIERCRAVKPRKRLESLAAVEEACRAALPDPQMPCTRSGTALSTWTLVEEGIGWLALNKFAEAEQCFRAVRTREYEPLVTWGLERCGRSTEPKRPGGPRSMAVHYSAGWRSYIDVAARGAKLEAARDFRAALQLYREVLTTRDDAADVYLAQARCQIELGETGPAIALARRAIVENAEHPFARAVLVRALLAHGEPGQALVEADKLVVSAADDAVGHYLRGKALLALGRLGEARDVFDLALSLDPKLVEAILLRREADRMLVKLGQVVGSQQTVIDIPESLAELRSVLLGGRTFEAIAALSRPQYAANHEAQLLLARFVIEAGDPESAIAIYDTLLDTPHRRAALVGKASVLCEQCHLESALALYDGLVGDYPNDPDVCEGRARTLDKLGRFGEAAAEFRRFVALATQGSDLRVRAAELWLDQH